MRAPQENTQESQKENIQLVQQEHSTGGKATITDNRPAIAVQRKLISAMESSENVKVPIQRKTNNTGLPDNLKSGIENLSGYSMDDVKVHYNSSKPAQLQAHAYAQGTDIHLAPGQEKHLPHEAWHVVQQKQGRVQPTKQLKSKVDINDDVGLEKEADVMGSKAFQMNSFTKKKNFSIDESNTLDGIVQKKDVLEDIVLNGHKEKEIKKDLEGCIQKFRDAINYALENLDGENIDYLNESLDHSGRDAFFYRSIFTLTKSLRNDLSKHKKSWKVSRTGGLLADIGLALRNVPAAIFTGGFSFEDIMSPFLQKGSNHIRGREENGELVTSSEWSDEIIDGNSLESRNGPSSTTTQLLHVISSIGTFSETEVEAMMIALIKFWKKRTKRYFGGGSHSAVEVWAPYQGYLEAKQAKRQAEHIQSIEENLDDFIENAS